MNIVSAVPLVHLPQGNNEFDYALSDALAQHSQNLIGCAVLVSFRGRTQTAIITQHKKHTLVSPERIKPIKKVLTDFPIIEKNFLEWYQTFANYYHIGLAHALRIGLPHIPRHRQVLPKEFSTHRYTVHPRIHRPVFLHYNNQTDLTNASQEIIQKAHRENCPVLIICPTQDEAEYVWQVYSKFFPAAQYADSRVRSSELFQKYLQFLHGNIPLLIGTRKLFFWQSHVPYVCFLHNAHDVRYKLFDTTPRYDLRTLFLLRKKIPHCRLVSSGSSIPIEFFYEIQKETMEYQKYIQKKYLHIQFAALPPVIDDTMSEKTFVLSTHTTVPSTRLAEVYTMVIIKNFDILCNNIFFNAWERCHHLVESAKLLLKPHGTLCIQSTLDTHPVCDTKNFLFHELQIRKSCGLPPQKKLIKIILPNHIQKDDFKKALETIRPALHFLTYTIDRKHSQTSWCILILCITKTHENMLFLLLQSSPWKKCMIDINPISLL